MIGEVKREQERVKISELACMTMAKPTNFHEGLVASTASTTMI